MIVEAIELTKIYGEGASTVKALDQASIQIEPGEFVAIMGPSGSGESTLLHLMGGLDSATSGRITVEGNDVTTLKEDELARIRRQKIGFIFQSYNLVAVLTAEENVALPLLMDGCKDAEIKRRVDKAIQMVGLEKRGGHRPSQLSGGEQQRVAIARALVNNPGIVLADEPTGNLDSVTAEDVMGLLRRLRDENGQAIVMVTHDPKMAAYADRIVFLKDGKVIDEERLGGKIDQNHLASKLKGTVS
ncbi:MAG: ABC transporter ATP-binding protein [Actinobacteria bacterium]|nr:ABC transporter ATP-binding protein [Actinomycetota bacterium]